MRSSEVIIAPARRLILAAMLALSVPAAFAEAPPAGNRDDLDVTMRTIVNPGATEPDEIVRQIPAPRAKKPKQEDDSRANELADPGNKDTQDDGGTAGEPGSPEPGIPTGTDNPNDPGVPGPGSAPDPRENPGNLGHQGPEDARHHGEEAHRDANAAPPDHQPHGPKSKPPEQPGPKQPGPKHPDPKPPGTHPPHGPPGGPPHGPPHGPRHGPGPRG